MEEGRDANSIPFDCRALYNCGNFIADINFPHTMFFTTKIFSFNRRFLNRIHFQRRWEEREGSWQSIVKEARGKRGQGVAARNSPLLPKGKKMLLQHFSRFRNKETEWMVMMRIDHNNHHHHHLQRHQRDHHHRT